MKCYRLDEVLESDADAQSKMISILISKDLKERCEAFFNDNPGTSYSTILDLFLTREGYPAK